MSLEVRAEEIGDLFNGMFLQLYSKQIALALRRRQYFIEVLHCV